MTILLKFAHHVGGGAQGKKVALNKRQQRATCWSGCWKNGLNSGDIQPVYLNRRT
jgi:hypothetical protein